MSSWPANARLRSHWLDASGGLVWHWRALHYRNTRWRPFRENVATWLAAWQPPTHKLLIVGPSAGYTLNLNFLLRWQEVVVLEPDPLARWLLRRRFPSVCWRFENLDVLANLAILRTDFSAYAVLFSNVLGQVTPREEKTIGSWQPRFRATLKDMHWASYHDVISTAQTPRRAHASLETTDLNLGMTLEDVLACFWSGEEGHNEGCKELALVDHGTFGLAEAADTHYCIWPLRPKQFHLVAWARHEPG